MITKAIIALMLFGLTSSANAMTVIFKDYKAANNDEKAFYYLYLDGVREGIIELNVVQAKKQQPLFCVPEKLELTVGQAEDIVMRQAEKITDPDQLFLLDFFSRKVCKIRFPATKSISNDGAP